MKTPNRDYSEQIAVDCIMSSREYYDFRLQALTHKVHFLVRWEKTQCVVTCEAPFLAKCGYSEGIDF